MISCSHWGMFPSIVEAYYEMMGTDYARQGEGRPEPMFGPPSWVHIPLGTPHHLVYPVLSGTDAWLKERN